MKKQIKYSLIAGAITLSLFLVAISLSWMYVSKFNRYELSPDICKLMTGVPPEEFVETKAVGTPLENGYFYARVNKDGNLVLLLTDEEQVAWESRLFSHQLVNIIKGDTADISAFQDDEVFSSLFAAAAESDIQISDDYTKCYIDSDDIFLLPGLMLAWGCVGKQVLTGKPCEEIKVEIFFLGSDGQVLETYFWPEDTEKTITFPLKEKAPQSE